MCLTMSWLCILFVGRYVSAEVIGRGTSATEFDKDIAGSARDWFNKLFVNTVC